MMAVAENVHRDGKSMQDSEAASVRVTGAASVSSARAAFGFRMAAFSVMLALGVAAFSPAPASGIIADKSAPKTNKPLFFRQQTVCRKSIFKLRHPKAFLLTDSSSSMLMKKA